MLVIVHRSELSAGICACTYNFFIFFILSPCLL